MKAIIIKDDSIVTCPVPNDMSKDFIEEYLSHCCGFEVSKYPYHLLNDPTPAEGAKEDMIPVFKAGQFGTNIFI